MKPNMNPILKRFYHSWLAWMLVFCGLASGLGINNLAAQTATGPEQDCAFSLPVVRPVIVQQVPYSGSGVNASDISGNVASSAGCANASERNSTWYRLVVGATGTLAFTITPENGTDDYNFIAYRAPAGTTGFTSCQMSVTDAARIVACNFAPGGFTGASNAQRNNFPNNFAPSINVNAGDIILISVNNFTGTSGFTLDFRTSSTGVIPAGSSQTAPTISIQAVQTQAANGGCSAPSVVNVTFSQPVLRGSIQPSSLVVQSADGTRNFTVTNVACTNCSPDNTGTPTFALMLNTPITESGIYRVSTSNTATAITARDLTNAPIVLPASTSFVVNIGNRIPTVQVGSATALNTPQSQSFCLGRTLRLTAEDGGSSARYQWVTDDGTGVLTDIVGKTSRTLDIAGRYAGDITPSTDTSFVLVQIGQATTYRVRVIDGNGCSRISSTASISVSGGLQASITVNNTTFDAGGTGIRSFRACRSDGATLVAQAGFQSYQWYANGRPIDTARSRTFFARENGLYTVETVDAMGCRNVPAPIQLIPFDTPTPLITGPDINCPNPATGRVTSPVTLTSSTDPAYRTFQWLDSLDRPITTASGNTISVTTGTFKVRVVTNDGCTLTATKTVRPGQNPGTVSIFPDTGGTAVSLCPGGFFTLQASFIFPSYKWFRDGVEIIGATQRTYNANVAGSYQVQGIGADGCATALSMPPLRVENATVPTPTITPAGGTLRFCRGTSIRLSVTNGDNFEWTFNDDRVPFATTREITATREGRYSVRITFNSSQLAGCPISTSANVVAVDNPTPVVLNPAPDSLLCQGETRILRADAGYDSYQWLRDGTLIPGATMQNLSVTVSGVYTVRVTAFGGCTGTSATFRVTVVPAPGIPTIASSTAFLICPNGSSELSVSNPEAGVTYQWFRETQAIPNATGPRLTIVQRGSYTVEARNANGCTSRPMSPSLVDTTQLPTPPVLPRTLVICPNASTTVDAGANFMSYQWLLNGTPIMGATMRQYAIRAAGRYNVRVSNMQGCINTSADIVVTQTAVNVTIAPIDFGVRLVARSTPPPQRFQWLLNGVNIPGAIDSIIAPQLCGSYNVRVTDTNGCADTARVPTQYCPPTVSTPDSCAVNAVCPPTPPGGTGAIRNSNIIAAPGDTVTYRFRLGSYGTLQPGARITANLCFNATLLEPLPPLVAGTIANGIRCIPLSFTLPANINDALAITSFRAALGNDSTTVLRLQDIQLQPGGALLPTTSGTFRLTNISYAGGARLIGPAPRMRLAPGAQNPTSDVAVVKYTLENTIAGDNTVPVLPVAITMSDVFGRIVKTSAVQQLLGNVGEVRMDVADLTPGVYFITIRTNNTVSVQRIQVMR